MYYVEVMINHFPRAVTKDVPQSENVPAVSEKIYSKCLPESMRMQD